MYVEVRTCKSTDSHSSQLLSFATSNFIIYTVWSFRGVFLHASSILIRISFIKRVRLSVDFSLYSVRHAIVIVFSLDGSNRFLSLTPLQLLVFLSSSLKRVKANLPATVDSSCFYIQSYIFVIKFGQSWKAVHYPVLWEVMELVDQKTME